MTLSLKVKLTISYLLISLFLVFSLLFTAKHMLTNQFENYIIESQEKSSNEIVNQVIASYESDGTPPSTSVLENIGQAALAKGFILRVDNNNNETLVCMDCLDQKQCGDMLTGMAHNMDSIYPNFNGQYVEKSYHIEKNHVSYGSVILGYYGPFFYNNSDLQFLTMFNQILILSAVLSLIIAIGVGFFMANKITGPIKKVIEKTSMIEQGDYNNLIEVTSTTNEVGQLIRSVNSLASTLNTQQLLRKSLTQDYAHELRTPLASLQSNLEAMIDGIWKPNKERLESCHEEILRLTRMVSDISKLVEIEHGHMILNKTTFNLLEFTKKLLLNFEPSILEKNLILTVSQTPCVIYADKDKIGQVMINLISNAIKYSGQNGSIHISIIPQGANLKLSVRDTGVGISQEDLPYVFEHLYRTDKSRSSDTGGYGVGLAIVKAIVDAHHGEISIKSELSKGSTFTVTLPK